MTSNSTRSLIVFALCLLPLGLSRLAAETADTPTPSAPAMPVSLTPPVSPAPRINGPAVFGVRPGSPFLYNIPASGDRPMSFTADGLPKGLQLDHASGRITGVLKQKGEIPITLHAKNRLGVADKKFRIVVGDRIALTPPMGWSSWNCFGDHIDQQKILGVAQAMVSSKLSQHGFTYINIDDGWQGKRTGPGHALQGNEKFPDMAGLVKSIHDLGLKVGTYSTPWETSYAKYPGGSAETETGEWQKIGEKMGKVSFAEADARQWAAWGIDYMKYDWALDVPHTETMSKALRASGRDIVYSLSNNGRIEDAADYARLSECWRTSGDIVDDWNGNVSNIGFNQGRWTSFGGPGHWNDPDMLVIGQVGWGPKTHPTRLTPDQQYSHISLWCLLSAPLIMGGDLTQLDAFTLGLLTNDEVLAVNQDELGRQGERVGSDNKVDFYLKPLADGSFALGIFNRNENPVSTGLTKIKSLMTGDKFKARDLWRQQTIADFNPEKISFALPPHGVVLLRLLKTP